MVVTKNWTRVRWVIKSKIGLDANLWCWIHTHLFLLNSLTRVGGSLSWNWRVWMYRHRICIFRRSVQREPRLYSAAGQSRSRLEIWTPVSRGRSRKVRGKDRSTKSRSCWRRSNTWAVYIDYHRERFVRWFSTRLLPFYNPVLHRGRDVPEKWWCPQHSYVHWVLCGKFNHSCVSSRIHHHRYCILTCFRVSLQLARATKFRNTHVYCYVSFSFVFFTYSFF